MDYRSRASHFAGQFGVDPDLFAALIQQESGWNPKAVSSRGAFGLGQAMPKTAAKPGLNVAPLTDIGNTDEQLRFSAEYLDALMRRYGGNTNKALAAYNWGMGNADNWDGADMSKLPKETQNYIATITTNAGIPQGHPDQQPHSAMNFLPEAGADQPYLSGVAPEPPAETETRLGKLVGEKMPWLSDSRADKLLAIGTGLLSGDDWASGIASAGENLMAVRADEKARQQAAADANAEFQRDLMRDQINANQPRGYSRPAGQMEMKDGSFRGDLTWFPDGSFRDAKGTDMSDQVIGPVNNSDAYGSKGQPTYEGIRKTVSDLQLGRNALTAIDELIAYTDSDPAMGAEKLVKNTGILYKTLIGKGLTDDEIAMRVAQGHAQALIGLVREDVVGTGTMTEQDALRIISALGGEMKSIFEHPEAASARLKYMRDVRLQSYNENFDKYDADRKRWPQLGMQELSRYIPPEPPQAASQLADGGVKTPVPANWGVAQDAWHFLTPEEQAKYIRLSTPSDRAAAVLDQSNTTPTVNNTDMPSFYPDGPEAWAALPENYKEVWRNEAKKPRK